MRYYCGMDLGARECHVCVIDEDFNKLVDKEVRNELTRIMALLKPYEHELRIVVESTFNWYWLVDGLQESGYDVCLAHPLGVYMITAAKVKTDPRDAFALAKLLSAGMIPEAYIYPKETRPARDLLRRRAHLVNMRAEEFRFMQSILLRQGILDQRRNEVKQLIEEDLDKLFIHPLVQLHARQQLKRIHLYTDQILELEKSIRKIVQDQPEFHRLQTIPGIGMILALTIFYEVGEIQRFRDARHFASYCRLVPGVAQSGKSCRRGRGSKQGNHYLKWAFTQAATYAVRYYPKIRRCFDRHLRRHRGRARKLICYNIIGHKLARAAYHILRDGTQYRESLLFAA